MPSENIYNRNNMMIKDIIISGKRKQAEDAI